MFEVDHVAIWSPDRDDALAALSSAAALPILDGYAPDGRRVARGIRFGNGPFVDLHRADGVGAVLLGLSGDVLAGEALAKRMGWKARLTLHIAGGEPWSILSFAPDQGLLSRLFIIQYAADAAAWASPVFNGGLYHWPAEGGAELACVRLGTSDRGRADRDLRSLGFRPSAGGRYIGARADLELSPGEDGVAGLIVRGGDYVVSLALGTHVTAVVGGESQEG